MALRQTGTPTGPNDTAIDGQAIAAGAVLVTNNQRQFERVLEDWVKYVTETTGMYSGGRRRTSLWLPALKPAGLYIMSCSVHNLCPSSLVDDIPDCAVTTLQTHKAMSS